MPEPISIKSLFRTYEVVFEDSLQALQDEISRPGTFTIADPVALASLGGEVRLPEGRHRLFEPSEDRKTLDEVQELVKWLVDAQARRGGRLVALGGGVIQDVTAFTASILYRGLDWVFVPTTLLAQADSCIGSKTSINVGGFKNIAGNFYPPSQVIIHPGFLDSLPDVEIRSGVGEMLHFYVYADSPMLEPIIADYDSLLEDRGRLAPYIAESLRIKKSVIEVDEFDRGERNKFNYGHTFGHALEALTHFEIRHGQAVTVGMDLANYLSRQLGMLDPDADVALHSLIRVNFPDYRWEALEVGAYVDLLKRDKKNTDGDLTCILSRGRGRLEKVKVPMDDQFMTWIADYFTAGWARRGVDEV